MLTQGDHKLKFTLIIHIIFSLILGYLTDEDNKIHMFSIPSNNNLSLNFKDINSMLMKSIFSVFLNSIFLLNISSSPLCPYPLVSLKLENYLKLEINESLYSHVI